MKTLWVISSDGGVALIHLADIVQLQHHAWEEPREVASCSIRRLATENEIRSTQECKPLKGMTYTHCQIVVKE